MTKKIKGSTIGIIAIMGAIAVGMFIFFPEILCRIKTGQSVGPNCHPGQLLKGGAQTTT